MGGEGGEGLCWGEKILCKKLKGTNCHVEFNQSYPSHFLVGENRIHPTSLSERYHVVVAL